MYDSGKIVVGLAVLVGVTAFPVWYGLARGSTYKAKLEPPPNGATECVLPVKDGTMRAEHMRVLDQWRTEVVRDGLRNKVTVSGKEWDKSLSKTCLGCHSNKASFCDSCHNAEAVSPSCWDCHVAPPEGGQ